MKIINELLLLEFLPSLRKSLKRKLRKTSKNVHMTGFDQILSLRGFCGR